MPLGDWFVITGTLRRTQHGTVVEVDGGGFWIVFNTPWSARRHLNRRVIVEGMRCGFNELWLGKVSRADA